MVGFYEQGDELRFRIICDFLDKLNYSHLYSTEFPQNLLRGSEKNQEIFPQTVGSDSNSGLASVSDLNKLNSIIFRLGFACS
jgi:hypothetical protein